MADEADPILTSTPETPTSEVVEPSALGGAVEAEGATALSAADPAPAEKPEAVAEPAKTEVPEAYELTAPEGMTIDPKSVEIATPVFKELGLSNEQANKLMPVAAQWAQQIQDGANAQILAQVQADRKAWLTAAKGDDEIGGGKWSETIAIAASALDKLGMTKGTPFRNLLDESGLGNHPEMIRAFRKVGMAIGEDTTFTRGEGGGAKPSVSAILYPNDVKGG